MKYLLTLSYLLVYASFLQAQSIISVIPANANVGQTLDVTITGSGTHFQQGSAGTFVDVGFNQCSGSVNYITVNSQTSVVANITVPFDLVNGQYDMLVWSAFDGALNMDKLFQINSSVPNVTFNPDHGLPGQMLTVTVSGHGTHFQQSSGSTGIDFGQWLCNGINFSATNAFIDNDTTMEAHLTIPDTSSNGWYDVYLPGSGYNYPNVFLVGNPNGINKIRVSTASSVSPNPFNESTRLAINSSVSDQGLLIIYDLAGKEIYRRKNVALQSGNNNILLSSEDFQNVAGAYLVCFLTDDKRYFAKAMLGK